MSLVKSEKNKKIYPMAHKLPRHVLDIYNMFRTEGAELYLIGGYVRDLIMGNTPDDFDFVTPLMPKEIIDILEKNNIEYDDQYIDRVNYVIAFSQGVKIDLITYHGNSLYEDLSDRDFSFNSMAYDVENQEIIDYFGGLEDINNKIIRVVKEPLTDNDVSLPFRAVRFALQFGYKIDEDSYRKISEYIEQMDSVRESTVRKNLSKLYKYSKDSLT